MSGLKENAHLPWRLVGEPGLLRDPAVSAGADEVGAAFSEIGLELASEAGTGSANVVAVELSKGKALGRGSTEADLIEESSYRIVLEPGKPRTLRVSSPSPLGLAYGLFELADRSRVENALPTRSSTVRPELPYRILAGRSPVPSTMEGPESSDSELERYRSIFASTAREALKLGYNIIVLMNTQDYIPWGIHPYEERSARYRRCLKEFIRVAHDHHLRFMLMGDEFTYRPELLEKFGAAPSVKDEGLWEALKFKYRALLEACPNLDGIATRIGEHIPYFGLSTLDLIHSDEDAPDPRVEERYRRFIEVMHEVVSGEFGKLLLHRTWTVNVHEQHSVPQVYEKTFTSEVPKENLLLSIKLTSADQWYHCEPFNTTFGVTPHTTIAQGELFSGYQGACSYLVYPAMYLQAALEWAVGRGTRGILNGLSRNGLPGDAILYVFSRLGWNPRARVEVLTEQWAAKTFGGGASRDIAEIFLLAAPAIRDGLYLRQPGLHNWDPIRHLRCGDFVVKGNPEFDEGKGHDAFLREIYLECKPWLSQTFDELDRGVATYEGMLERFEACRGRIRDASREEELERLLHHGLAALKLNASYVKGFLSYFAFRDNPSGPNRERLEGCQEELRVSLDRYQGDFNHYTPQGILTFMELAGRALEDLPEAERILREAPSREDVLRIFSEARAHCEKRLEENPDAVPIAYWKGTVDGRDLLRIKDGSFSIEHISDDPIISPEIRPLGEIPKDRPCEIVVKPLDVRGAVYVKEQPTEANGFTVTLYLEDLTPGKYVVQFEIYAICG